MSIDGEARRVALLARPGLARERLSTVLEDAGALCVLAADPTELDPAALLESEPQVVVVALDPLIEEVLEQFDNVLGNPSIDVIYEEAEQAVNREGWDAARWQRHLVAKLQGHRNVLPPGRDPSTEELADAAGATTHAVDASAPATAAAFDPVNAEFEDFDVDAGSSASAQLMSQGGSQTPSVGRFELSLDSAQRGAGQGEEPAAQHTAPAESVSAKPQDALGDFDFSFELSDDDSVAGELDDAALDDGGYGAFDPVDAETGQDANDALGIGLAMDAYVDVAVEGKGEPLHAGAVPRQELSLQDDELEFANVASSADPSRHDLTQLHERISTLELVDDRPSPVPAPQGPRGAVLILSGLGGPDAVRQLLGALPHGFMRPVLVRQHLDGGRYDRLVTQLQRATALPVELAEPAQLAMAGTVYILSDCVGATSGEDGIRFSGDAGEAVMAALPPADSAVLLLSGSDPAQVDAAMAHGHGGALVAGQAADGCYDAAASNALAASGGDVASPAALALRLTARWSNQGSSNVQA